MAVLKVLEIMSSSKISWEDATQKRVAQAGKTLNNIRSAWIKDQSVAIKDGEVTHYRVTLKITFEVE